MSSPPRPGAAWFVDGAYLFKVWQALRRGDKFDYVKLRALLEEEFCGAPLGAGISEAIYFGAELDPQAGRMNAFHTMLGYPPPTGPGFDVRLYWLKRTRLQWPRSLGGGPVLHPESGVPYEVTQQKAVDVGLAFHLVRSHAQHGWRQLFLAAGDSDFHEPVQVLVEEEGVELILVGGRGSISQELQRHSRAVVEIDQVADRIRLD